MTNPRPESSPTPSHSPKPCMRKHLFQNNSCCFRNYTTEVSVKIWDYLSYANVLENLPKQSWSSSEMICWTVSQPHSPKIHHVKFFSKTFSFSFQFFMSCTHLISRLPQCILNALCHFTQYIYTQHMQIYHHAYIYII